ncbi:hypothetical protein AAFF_G00113920 [Aldrovandia affinis]|uniref:Cadherin domain-containing protein n=1 Tax=Aldrovandia affinis TaxID=143900 RepID=A0AAD7WAV3_9TELE|nr:hypothetical protein AAFF_G00113920 [Aldrovandia affinis]
MDKDTGNNALIAYSFSAGSSLLSLHNETGEITLTSDLSNIAEDTLLKLTALARDHGQPPRSSTATVLVSLFTTSFTPGMDFSSSAYNFSVAENEPESTLVGTVKASTGSSLFQVTYTLRSHRDLFIVDKQGRISTSQALDKETQEWYTMEVEAVDSRTPPNTAVAMVTVRVEDVNEAPEFSHTSYSAVIFSIAPYKHPVVRVKATDPDSGENGQLEYSLEEPSSLFDVERSSGQVYVLSVEGQEGQVSLHVKATDPLGLSATIEVEVMIQDSASSDAVVISLNQPVNIVDREILEMERSLGQALGLTVKVSSVRSANSFGGGVRSSRDSAKTYVTFIAMDASNTVVPSEEVERKLESESEAVQVQLEKVFGEGLEYTVEKGPGTPDSTDQTIAIVLGVLLPLAIVGLVVMAVVTSVK